MGPGEQCEVLPHSVQCVKPESDRVPVHGTEEVWLGQKRVSGSRRTGASHPEVFGLAQRPPRDSRRALALVPPKKRPIFPPCSSLKPAKLFNWKGH